MEEGPVISVKREHHQDNVKLYEAVRNKLEAEQRRDITDQSP